MTCPAIAEKRNLEMRNRWFKAGNAEELDPSGDGNRPALKA
jgi:hypothetical protein